MSTCWWRFRLLVSSCASWQTADRAGWRLTTLPPSTLSSTGNRRAPPPVITIIWRFCLVFVQECVVSEKLWGGFGGFGSQFHHDKQRVWPEQGLCVCCTMTTILTQVTYTISLSPLVSHCYCLYISHLYIIRETRGTSKVSFIQKVPPYSVVI